MVGTVEFCSCVLDLPCELLVAHQEACILVTDPGVGTCNDPLVAAQHTALAVVLEACAGTLTSISAILVGPEQVTDLVVSQQLQDLGCVHSPAAAAKFACSHHSTWKFAAVRRPVNGLLDAQGVIAAAQADASGQQTAAAAATNNYQGQHSVVQLHLEDAEPHQTITLVGLSGCSATDLRHCLQQMSLATGVSDASTPFSGLSQSVWDILLPYITPAQLVIALEEPSFLPATPTPDAQRMRHVLQEQQETLDSALLQQLQAKAQFQFERVAALEQDKRRLEEQVLSLQAEVQQLRQQQQQQEQLHQQQQQQLCQQQKQLLQEQLDQCKRSIAQQPEACLHAEVSSIDASSAPAEGFEVKLPQHWYGDKVHSEDAPVEPQTEPVTAAAAPAAPAGAARQVLALQPAAQLVHRSVGEAGCFWRAVSHFAGTPFKRTMSSAMSYKASSMPAANKLAGVDASQLSATCEEPSITHPKKCETLETAGSAKLTTCNSKHSDTITVQVLEPAASITRSVSQLASCETVEATPTEQLGDGPVVKVQCASCEADAPAPKSMPVAAAVQSTVVTATASSSLEDQLRVWRAALVESRRQVAVLTDRLVELLDRPSNAEVELMQEELILLRQECAAEAVQLSAAKAQVHALTAQLRSQSLLVSKLQAQLGASGTRPTQPTGRTCKPISPAAFSSGGCTQRAAPPQPRSMQPTAASLARSAAGPTARATPAKPDAAKRVLHKRGSNWAANEAAFKVISATGVQASAPSTSSARQAAISPRSHDATWAQSSKGSLGTASPASSVCTTPRSRDPAPKVARSPVTGCTIKPGSAEQRLFLAARGGPSRAESAPVDSRPAESFMHGLTSIITALSQDMSSTAAAPPTPQNEAPKPREPHSRELGVGAWHVAPTGLQQQEDDTDSPSAKVLPTSFALSSSGQASSLLSSAGPASPTASSEAMRLSTPPCCELACPSGTASTPPQSFSHVSDSSTVSCVVMVQHFLDDACGGDESKDDDMFELCMPPQLGLRGMAHAK